MRGRTFYISITAVVILVTFLGVFCENQEKPNEEVNDRVKSSEGLSTSSDTLEKEAHHINLDGLSVDELRKARESADKKRFEAEVDRMMKLIINSLYKNKEIFLRELISNASDALDKIRLMSLTDGEALKATPELAIRIKANKEAKTLHIIDTGMGMTKDELTANLGTIAKSGTSEFMEKLAASKSSNESSDLIGQFGVGFYSCFLVANRVLVVSKSNSDKQHVWESDTSSFSVFEDPRGDTLKRGTEIVLHLNEEANDYLEPHRLTELLKKYSQFINFPIYLWSSRTELVDETTDEHKMEKTSSDDDASVEEEKKTEPKKVEKTIWDWVLVNENKPIWTRKPADVTEDEYNEFYKAFTKDSDTPLAKIHFSAEGEISFRSILFIPRRSPMDLFTLRDKPQDSIKLYVRRVFITDTFDDLLPRYLGFIRGIVDSDDLPLNVSRETLQQNKLLKVIKKKLVRKAIEMFGKFSEEEYKKFWKEYSVHLKLGVVDDHSNRTRLAKLLRFWTSHDPEQQSSLSDYVSRMKKDQDVIYYLTGANLQEVRSSPLAERLIRKGFEVVYMVDPIDEYVSQSLTEFDGKKLQNLAKEGVKIDISEEAKARKEAQNKFFEGLLNWLQEDALKDLIEKAVISERLSESPCALVAGQFGWSGNMERIMLAQTHQKSEDSSTKYYAGLKKTLEINPRHPLVKELRERVTKDSSDSDAKATARLLYDMAVLRSGYSIHDTVSFATRIEAVMRKNLAVSLHEKAEDEDEELEVKVEQDRFSTETDEEHDEKSSIKSDGVSDATTEDTSDTHRAMDEL